jgi:hypothetical protein
MFQQGPWENVVRKALFVVRARHGLIEPPPPPLPS